MSHGSYSGSSIRSSLYPDHDSKIYRGRSGSNTASSSNKYREYKEEEKKVDYKKMYDEAMVKMDKMRKEYECKEQEWRMEKKKQERVISELEENVKEMESLKQENERLNEENTALVRVISRLSGS